MLRKLNFTERVRIPKSAVRITLRRRDDGLLEFDSQLALHAIDAPARARVFLEAYYRTSYMRFDCGTVTNPTLPDDRRLTEIDSSRLVRFRLKIVDEHRVVAVADDVVVSSEENTSSTSVPLLPVNFRDLQDEIWRVELEAGGPVLELNSRVTSIEQMAKNDGRFFSLVYPSAVRQILTHLLLVEEFTQEDDGEDAWSLWLRWAAQLSDAAIPENHDERRLWIDDVVRAFCARQDVLTRFESSIDR